MFTAVLVGCNRQGSVPAESKEAKQMLQGVWMDSEGGDVSFRVKGDTIFYSDTTSMPAYFKIIGDSLVLGSGTSYGIVKDSVVTYNGERYHWYIAINPTKYKVVNHTYNDDGLEVENVYYDNIMHISVFHGAHQIFSSDFRKQMYSKLVPAGFLDEAVLGAMDFNHIDADGLHFDATLCIPDGASCYMVDTQIAFTGKQTMKLMEY